MRALALALFWGARDWPASSLAHVRAIARLREVLGVLSICMRQMLLHSTPPGGSFYVYEAFDDLEFVRICRLLVRFEIVTFVATL